MKTFDIPVERLVEAPWNPNQMDQTMSVKLRQSLNKFGLVENLVVRPQADGLYEVLSGNQRRTSSTAHFRADVAFPGRAGAGPGAGAA